MGLHYCACYFRGLKSSIQKFPPSFLRPLYHYFALRFCFRSYYMLSLRHWHRATIYPFLILLLHRFRIFSVDSSFRLLFPRLRIYASLLSRPPTHFSRSRPDLLHSIPLRYDYWDFTFQSLKSSFHVFPLSAVF